MFDDSFSFHSGRSPSFNDDDDDGDTSSSSSSTLSQRCVSPCSACPPAPPPTLSELAAVFAHSRIRSDACIALDDCAAYANTDDDDAGWLVDPPAISDGGDHNPSTQTRSWPRSRQPLLRPHSPSQRAARQSNTRLLCSTAHRSDIAALVAHMVQAQNQCLVVAPPSSMPVANPSDLSVIRPSASAAASVCNDHEDDNDEGYDSSGGAVSAAARTRRSSLVAHRFRLDYRRSSDLKPSASTACVRKATRVRKDRPSVRHRGSEA